MAEHSYKEMVIMTPGTPINLTPDPGKDGRSRPKPRTGVVVESPWVMPWHVLVAVDGETFPDGSPKIIWLPKDFSAPV